MPKRPPINELAISRAKPLITLCEEDMPKVALDTKSLNQWYRNERQEKLETVAKFPKHNSLSLVFEEEVAFGLLPLGRIVWIRGHCKHNNKEAVERRKSKTILTQRIHHCGETGDYTKRNVTQALRYAEPWERELTWSYEKLAQKLRAYLRSLSRMASGVVYCETYPDIPAGGPNADPFDVH